MTENIDTLFWARLNRLGERVTALESQGARPSVLIDLPRTVRDWYELIHSINKFMVWLIPRFIIPVWGLVQNWLPWLYHTGIPALLKWLGF